MSILTSWAIPRLERVWLLRAHDYNALADPGGGPGGPGPPDPQIWRPQLYNLEAQCTI